ncbi:MAG: extracellular solute-binding protein [Caldilineaceae bacterium]|nr:extracellular solute-binding protein [Caldilineaceae bacterium]
MNKQPLSRRSFLRLSAVTAAGVALVACAPAAAPSGESGGEAAPSGERKELSISIVDYVEETQKVLEDDLFPSFEAAAIVPNYTAWDRYNEEMTTAFAGGVTPDLFQGGAVWAPQMAKRGWSLALDDFIAAASDEWNWADWFPALQDDATIDGKVVAVPYRFDIRSFWYRQDVLDEVGAAGPPTNWEELREFANAATVRDGDTITREGFHYSSPGGWQNDLQPYMYFMEMADGQFLSDDLSTCTLDSDPCIEAMQYVHALIVEDKVQPYPGFENQGDLLPIVAGMAGSTMSSSDPERVAQQYAPDEFEQLQVTLPLQHTVQATHVWVNKWFISSLSKEPELTWDLLTHMTGVENQEKYSASGLYQPPRQSLENAAFMTDRMKVLFQSTTYARPYPKHWRLIELFRPFAQELELCLSGQQSPEDTMTKTCAAINEILAEDA